MKKFKRLIPLLLCAVLMLQMAALPASATQATETQAAQTGQTQSGETQATAATEVEFGAVSIDSGCRTIDGKIPLAGAEQKLDTAQAAFLYEVNTDTVVYSFNPDMRLAAGGVAGSNKGELNGSGTLKESGVIKATVDGSTATIPSENQEDPVIAGSARAGTICGFSTSTA